MKRDPRLAGLSSEHHGALVLARRLGQAASAGDGSGPEVVGLRERFADELEPHFRVEEEVLLAALDAAGEPELAARTREDHAFLRDHVTAAAAGDLTAMADFAERLMAHVRFEERELFPRCEALLRSDVLDEVQRRAPKVPTEAR